MVTSGAIIASSLFIWLYTLVFAAYPGWRRLRTPEHKVAFPMGEALASGIFLGAGLLHMLPESSESFVALGTTFPMAMFVAGSIFLFLLLLEHIGQEHYHHCGSDAGFAILAVTMFSVHALLAGMALGVDRNVAVFASIFIAIVAHKWAESFSLAVQLARVRAISNFGGMALFLLYASMTPLGALWIGLAWWEAEAVPTVFHAWINALSAGTFIYLGTLHGLNRAVLVQRCCNVREYFLVIIGFLVMAAVKLFTEG